jgi:hexosaminidase
LEKANISTNIYLSCLMKNSYFIILLVLPFFCSAQSIIPQPLAVFESGNQFNLKNATQISYNEKSLAWSAKYLGNQVYLSCKVKLKHDNGTHPAFYLRLTKPVSSVPKGSYKLKINQRLVTIESESKEGIFYGIQSLLQLINTDTKTISAVEINDAPRYQWRGFMLDESRHFFGKTKVKKLLDMMARYKLNRFHWHLTDSHGWRLQIKKYPRLTTVGGIGDFTDSTAIAKYYTQDDIREIVAYAQERYIIVVPEIDMPGHATAANRAYPEFSGGSTPGYANFTFDPANEATYKYLSTIIGETNRLFPAKMIHLGGDEVFLGIQAWLKNPAAVSLMASKGFKTPTDLEHYFFKRMGDTVIKFGSKVLCWDEAVETDLPADKTIVFWWRQNKPQNLKLALDKNYYVVLCPRLPMYFDFVQDSTHISGRKWDSTKVTGYQLQRRYNTLQDVYNFPDKYLDRQELKSKNIIGIQANLWTETVGTEKRLDYLIFPRMAALAEAAWSTSVNKNKDAFNNKLKAEIKWYKKAELFYYNPFEPAEHLEVVDYVPKKQVKD